MITNILKKIKIKWKYLLILWCVFAVVIFTRRPFDLEILTDSTNISAMQTYIDLDASISVAEQTIIASRNGLKKVGIIFVKNGNTNQDLLQIQIKDKKENRLIYENTIDCSDLQDSTVLYLEFEEEQYSKDREYSLIFSWEQVTNSNTSIRIGVGASDADAGLMLDGSDAGGTVYCHERYVDSRADLLYIILWIMLIVLASLAVLLIDERLEHNFLVISFTVGLTMIILNPFPHVLDEVTHTFRSMTLSSGQLLQTTENGNIGGYVPENFGGVADYRELTMKSWIGKDIFSEPFSKNDVFYSNPFVSSVVPINHMVAAAGLLIGRLFNFPSGIVLYMGRLAVYLFYVILSYFSIKRAQYYKNIFFITAILPTAYFLAGSFSTDPILISASLLFTAISLDYCFNDEKKYVTRKDLFLMILLPVFIVSVKYLVYAPILLLFLLIPKNKFRRNERRWAVLTEILLIIVMVAAQIWLLKLFPFKENRNGNVDVAQQIMYILQNPISFLRTFMNYIINNLTGIISNQSIYVVFPQVQSFAMTVGVIILALVEPEKKVYADKKRERLMYGTMFFIFVAVSAMIIGTLYLGFTPVGSDEIDGVQMRYFIPVLPILLVLIGKLKVVYKNRKLPYIVSFIGLLMLLNELMQLLIMGFSA